MASTVEVSAESAWLNAAPPWGTQGVQPQRAIQLATAAPNPSGNRKRKAPEISDAEIQLGKLAKDYARRLREVGWTDLVASARGRSNINEAVATLPHRAARLLSHLSKRGVSVPTSTVPWSKQRKDDAIQRGPHQSSQGERQFVAEEMLDFCAQGYWIVLPYDAVSNMLHLRVSPMGVVPQRDRRPRLIVDYTFSGVNAETLSWAPREAMQFGRALQRVFTTIVHADQRYGPVFLAKIDIADGFYRVWLHLADIVKLGVAIPTAPGCPLMVAFPLALPMGWVESPPYFCTLTETACDRANDMLSTRSTPCLNQAHRLEQVASTPPPADADEPSLPRQTVVSPLPTLKGSGRPPVARVDVYVDDFLLMAQTKRQQQKVLRATLTAIDEVLRPVAPTDPVHRKEPASVKKMLKGDAHWSTRKRILGWDIDTCSTTLHLPHHRMTRLREVLAWLLPPQRRLPVRKWHQLLGELRSMSPALPGTRGLFSVLQEALRHTDAHRIRITTRIQDMALDFLHLVDSVYERPTRLQELVPTAPSDIGACDACQHGMGGVWFDMLDPTTAPIVWRERFPPHVVHALITADNPKGTVSISDLELTGMIAHKDVLARSRDIAERTVWLASDNRAAVAWSTKGSATSVTARASLLRYNALHQRAYRYVARNHYIPGPVNMMADDASRRWELSDDQLLSHFNTHYPQALSWQIRTLPRATNAILTGALSKKRAIPGSHINAMPPPPQHGSCGRPSVPASASTPMPWTAVTQSLFSNSSPTGIAPARSHPDVGPCGLAQWKMPYERWVRRTPGWGPLTLV